MKLQIESNEKMKIKQTIRTAIAIVSLAAASLSANAATFVLNAKIKSPRGTYRIVEARVSDTEPRCVFIRTPWGFTSPTVVQPILFGYSGRTPIAMLDVEFKDSADSRIVHRLTFGGYGRSPRSGKVSGNVVGAGFAGTFAIRRIEEFGQWK